MTTIRRTVSSLVFLAATAPAMAGGFTINKVPLNGVLAPADGCPYERAVTVLTNNAMQIVANVPRVNALHRFVVDWKSDLFAVTVSANNCRIDVVDYAKRILPYCDYIPGVMSSCPRNDVLAQ
jgi:hypothetical protein